MSFHIFQSLIGKDLTKLTKTLVEKGEFELFFIDMNFFFCEILYFQEFIHLEVDVIKIKKIESFLFIYI